MTFKLALVGSAALALIGCAQNAATVDIAKGVSEKSTSTMREVAAYYDDIEVRRRKAAAIIVASDVSCLPTSLTLQLQGPSDPKGRQGPLCPTAGVARGHRTYMLDLSPTPDAVIKPHLLLVTAVTDYGAALGKIAADPAADVSAEITSFAEKVDRVGSFLSFVTGDTMPTVAGVRESDEGVAIENLLKFAVELQQEAEQARRIKELVRKDGDKVDKALVILSAHVDIWARGELAALVQDRRAALERAYKQERRRMSFSERQSTAEVVFETQAEEKRVEQISDTLVHALTQVQVAQKELRDAVVGKFSEKRKRQIARQNLDRLTRALEMIASLGTAFG